MSHYNHKSIPVVKFEADSFSGFGDMTSQNSLLKKGTSESSSLATSPRKTGLTLNVIVNFSNFQAEEIFSFSKYFGRLDKKRAAATPPPRFISFTKIL